MTDINALAREIADVIGERPDGIFMEMAIAAMQRVRQEAFEEAAQLAENHQNHAMGMPQHAASQEIAAAIRALKDVSPAT